MHPHCRSRSSTGRLVNSDVFSFRRGMSTGETGCDVIPKLFSSLCETPYPHHTHESTMKADQTLSTIFRQLRPSLRQPHLAKSHLRPLSQLAPLHHPSLPRPSCTPKRGILQPSCALRSRQIRQVSDSTSAPASAVAHSPDYPSNNQIPPEKPPAYELTFTCKPCKHRSTHTVSKQGYHKGTVLITCPQCSNRHVMSDHLKVGFRCLCVRDAKRKGSRR